MQNINSKFECFIGTHAHNIRGIKYLKRAAKSASQCVPGILGMFAREIGNAAVCIPTALQLGMSPRSGILNGNQDSRCSSSRMFMDDWVIPRMLIRRRELSQAFWAFSKLLYLVRAFLMQRSYPMLCGTNFGMFSPFMVSLRRDVKKWQTRDISSE